MTDRKIIPFRKRPLSKPELEVFRRITRNWHPEMQRLMLPEYVKRDPSDAKS